MVSLSKGEGKMQKCYFINVCEQNKVISDFSDKLNDKPLC